RGAEPHAWISDGGSWPDPKPAENLAGHSDPVHAARISREPRRAKVEQCVRSAGRSVLDGPLLEQRERPAMTARDGTEEQLLVGRVDRLLNEDVLRSASDSASAPGVEEPIVAACWRGACVPAPVLLVPRVPRRIAVDDRHR